MVKLSTGSPAIPPLIRRNTLLLALSQSFTGASMGLAYGIGPLMVLALTESASLAGLSVALIALSRFIVAYPIGQITDRYGRKPGILVGLALGLIGALALGAAMSMKSLTLFVIGLLVFAMGIHASQQLRVAVTDMFPPQRRGQALGFLAMGSMLGLLICPLIIIAGEWLALHIGSEPLGMPWYIAPLLIFPAMLVVRYIRPDPKEIGMHLNRYYPDLVPPPPRKAEQRIDFSGWHLFRYPPTRLAIVANGASSGNMSIVMVLMTLVLAHHGHSLAAIAFSHMFHTAGMFGFTILLGRLADRIGRAAVMMPGVLTTIAGAALVGFTSAYWSITLGTFLVGIGWAAANVAATALIADHVQTAERGRAIGVNDSVAGGVSVFVAITTGPLIQWSGLPAAGWLAVLIAAVPIAMAGLAWTERRAKRAEESA
ncbi:MAG: MFS transporter [Betaproteobacteria bacterium]|nr:MFS transporter [Betaproteobacteria bacterium]